MSCATFINSSDIATTKYLTTIMLNKAMMIILMKMVMIMMTLTMSGDDDDDDDNAIDDVR